jgi:hypothetical protein
MRPGAVGALAVGTSEGIAIAQFGDTLAVWRKGKKIGGTPNQFLAAERKLIELKKKLGNGRQKGGQALSPAGKVKFYSLLAELQEENANVPSAPFAYGWLNGDPRFTGSLFETVMSVEECDEVVLFTDGANPLPQEESSEEIASAIFRILDRGNAGDVISQARAMNPNADGFIVEASIVHLRWMPSRRF